MIGKKGKDDAIRVLAIIGLMMVFLSWAEPRHDREEPEALNARRRRVFEMEDFEGPVLAVDES